MQPSGGSQSRKGTDTLECNEIRKGSRENKSRRDPPKLTQLQYIGFCEMWFKQQTKLNDVLDFI